MMTIPKTSTTRSRSPAGLRHPKSEVKSAADSPVSKPDRKRAITKPKSDGGKNKSVASKSRSRAKTEVETPIGKPSPQRVNPRERIKEEEEVQEQSLRGEVKPTGKGSEPQELEEEENKKDGIIQQRSKRKRTTKTEDVEVGGAEPTPKRTRRNSNDVKEEEAAKSEASPVKVRRKRRKFEEEEKEELDENGETTKKIKRKRKTKEEKEAEAMPLAARSDGLRMFIGAHVSCAKGVHNSVANCVHIGGNAFAMFLKSQRKWENPPLQDEHRDLFISSCGDHKYDASSHVLPHGSYLVNLAQEEPEKATQAYNAFVDDLHRCEAMGIRLYNFHPGSTGSHPRPSAIARIASALNRAHAATKTVIPVLETMAGGGNVVGSTFEDLRDVIALVNDKTRIGVCLDTCHVFAAGYDLRSPAVFKKTLNDFDEIVGMKYLRALHLNDSKAPFSSHRDLHQNIGLGFLGLHAFHNVMNEPRFEGLPMVLETPIDRKDEETGKDIEDKGVWAREIKMLEGLIGTDADSKDFNALEKELADKGAEERRKLQEQYDKKVEKDRKAMERGQTKLQFGGKKKKKSSEHGSESEA